MFSRNFFYGFVVNRVLYPKNIVRTGLPRGILDRVNARGLRRMPAHRHPQSVPGTGVSGRDGEFPWIPVPVE
jgi:hypothetical protein